MTIAIWNKLSEHKICSFPPYMKHEPHLVTIRFWLKTISRKKKLCELLKKGHHRQKLFEECYRFYGVIESLSEQKSALFPHKLKFQFLLRFAKPGWWFWSCCEPHTGFSRWFKANTSCCCFWCHPWNQAAQKFLFKVNTHP